MSSSPRSASFSTIAEATSQRQESRSPTAPGSLSAATAAPGSCLTHLSKSVRPNSLIGKSLPDLEAATSESNISRGAISAQRLARIFQAAGCPRANLSRRGKSLGCAFSIAPIQQSQFVTPEELPNSRSNCVARGESSERCELAFLWDGVAAERFAFVSPGAAIDWLATLDAMCLFQAEPASRPAPIAAARMTKLTSVFIEVNG